MASKVVLIIIFVVDLIAFGLAVAAEQRRSKAQVVTTAQKDYTYCSYDSDISTGYGVGAFLLLLASQILVMAVSKCFCCGRSLKPGGSRACALILFLLAWLCFFIAEFCLLAGSVRNAYHTKYRGIFGGEDLTCQTLRKGVFGAGAAFILFTAILTEFYYISFSKANEGGGGSIPPYGQEHGVGMSSYR